VDSFIKQECFEWPTEPGNYWFYGYRYGKMFGSKQNDKELVFATAFEIGSGGLLMVIGDGQHFSQDELEEPQFIKATIPELPAS
jgi:hypothetical protein